MKIYTLNEALRQPHSVRHIEIELEHGKPFPAAQLQQFPALSSLTIAAHHKTPLPIELSELPNITALYFDTLSGAIDAEVFGQLTHLKKLDFSCSPLKFWPDSLGQLSQLEELNLSGCQLETLPVSILNLKSLKKLDISYNQLQELPEGFFNLKKLTHLYIQHNQLHTLSKNITTLRNLKTLDASNNKIRQVESCFWQRLEVLQLSNNKLEALPAFMDKTPDLIFLDISNNQLEALPDAFYDNRPLEHLNISYNQLKELPPSLAELNNAFVSIPHNAFQEPIPKHLFLNWKQANLWGSLLPKPFIKISYAFFEMLDEYIIQNFYTREKIYNLLTANRQQTFGFQFLWGLLGIPFLEPYVKRQLAAEFLYKGIPPIDNMRLSYMGDLPFNLEKLKEQCQILNVTLEETPGLDTDCVILGQNISIPLTQPLKTKVVHAEQVFNILTTQLSTTPKTISDSQNSKKLRSLLLHKNENNVRLALEFLHFESTDKSILTPLFLVSKNTKFSREVRQLANTFLQRIASPKLRLHLQKNRTLIHPKINESKLTANLNFYCKNTELEAMTICEYIYNRTGLGMRFWLSQLPIEEARQKVKELEKHSDFILSIHHVNHLEELLRFANVRRLSLSGANLQQLPEMLTQFMQLEYLDLSKNRLRAIPAFIDDLFCLNHLNISNNQLEQFPAILAGSDIQMIRVAGNPFLKNKNQVKQLGHFLDTSGLPNFVKPLF